MFDLLIKNGTVYDGSGNPGFRADVAIRDGKIASVGENLGEAVRVIDAAGLAVTPGFIDSHSHADGAIVSFPAQRERVNGVADLGIEQIPQQHDRADTAVN